MKRNIGALLAALFLLAFVVYAGFEIWKYLSGPSLIVRTPKDLDTVSNPLVKVEGEVARVSYISINGKQIFADTKGYFEDELLLPPGYTIIRVAVKDRFGKEVYKDIRLEYIPQAKAEPEKAPETDEGDTEATSTEILEDNNQ